MGFTKRRKLLAVTDPSLNLLAGPGITEAQGAGASTEMTLPRKPSIFLIEDPVVVRADIPQAGLDFISKGALKRCRVTRLHDGNALAELQVVAVLRSLGGQITEPSVSGGDRASRGGVVGVPLLVAVVLARLTPRGVVARASRDAAET